MYLPIATPPVKVTRSTCSLVISSSAISARVAGDHLEHLRRQPRLVEDVGEDDRRQRHLLRRLEHHPVVGDDRRHDLVRHLVHRVVERRDRADHAEQRVALGVDAALLAVRREVAGEDLAVVLEAFAGAEQQHVADPADLVERVLLAEAALGGDQVGELCGAVAHDRRRLVEHRGAVEAGQLRLEALGDGEGALHVLDRRLRHRADQLLGVRIEDLDHPVAVDGLAADPHRLAAQFPGIHAVAPVVVPALATPMKFLPRTPSSAFVIMRADSASVTP